MSSTPDPPQRPRARAMLDASEKQTVGAPEREVLRRTASSSTPKTATPQRTTSSGIATGARKPTTASLRSSTPWKETSFTWGGRKGGTGRPGSSGTKNHSKPAAQRPADAAKAPRRPIKIHTKRAPMKWTFGGLTISVRLLVVLAVVGVLVVTLVPLGLQWVKQEQAYHSAVNEVATAQARVEELQGELEKWNQEDYIAAQARERLGYVRPGETQYVITDAPEPEEDKEHAVAHNNATGPEKPWAWTVLESLKNADQPPASAGLVDSPRNGEGG